jgi:hypothetical protein
MSKFLDEVINVFKPTQQPEFLQEVVEPEKRIPVANTEVEKSE